MPNGYLADEDKLYLQDQRLAGSPFATHLVMGLFTGAPTVDHTSTLASIAAHELAVAGYARQAVAGWVASTLTADFHALSTAAGVTFANSSGSPTSLITGWFYVDTLNNKLVMAGLYDTPFVILAGGTYVTTPFWESTGELV